MKNAGSLEEGKKTFDEVIGNGIKAHHIPTTMQNPSYTGETLEGGV